MVLMIFRPQGLIPVRQKLLALATQVYRASTGKYIDEARAAAPASGTELRLQRPGAGARPRS